MIAQKTHGPVTVKSTVDTSPLRVVNGRKRYERRSLARLRERERTLNGPKVCAARRLLAAGRYDSEELLDLVLDMLIADLRS